MASKPNSAAPPATTFFPSVVSPAITESTLSSMESFMKNMGVSNSLPDTCTHRDAYSDILTRSILKVDRIEPGRIICTLTVKPVVTNYFGSLHGSAVAAVAEKLGLACVKTVMAEDKQIFLGELGISYLSTARRNVEVEVDGYIVRSGRNIVVTATEFRIKKTRQLVYTARATFYNMPVANL